MNSIIPNNTLLDYYSTALKAIGESPKTPDSTTDIRGQNNFRKYQNDVEYLSRIALLLEISVENSIRLEITELLRLKLLGINK
jgi:hypothetical protein